MDHIEIRLCGTGGQGLILGALVLAEAMSAEGYQVAQSQAFEPVSRGGVSRSDLVIARSTPEYPLATQLDMAIILDQCAVEVSADMLRPGGLLLTDSERVPQPPNGDLRLFALPLTEAARKLRNPRVTNMVALAALAQLGGLCSPQSLQTAVRSSMPSAAVEASLEALQSGAALASAIVDADTPSAAGPGRSAGDS